MPKSYGSRLKGGLEGPLHFETGTECHDHLREIDGLSRQNCLNNVADGAIYGRKLDLC